MYESVKKWVSRIHEILCALPRQTCCGWRRNFSESDNNVPQVAGAKRDHNFTWKWWISRSVMCTALLLFYKSFTPGKDLTAITRTWAPEVRKLIFFDNWENLCSFIGRELLSMRVQTMKMTWPVMCNASQQNCLFRSFQEIIRRVREFEVPIFRPTVLNIIEDLDELRDLMKTCWEEDPDSRPDFPEIKRRINRILVTRGM